MATIRIDKNVMVPMRDGVQLATDVYRLDDRELAPVLLARTPYHKEHAVTGIGVPFDILRAVQAGYAVVIQDVRGRYASEGRFHTHFQEADDGADTIAWAAAQPWSSGVVGGIGGSYLGCTQWLAAREQPEALRTLAPAVTPADAFEGMAYQGGANAFHGLRWAVRYRTSLAEPELLEPDVVYEFRLDLWATANVFLPGHRIRLEVSSSNFPRFGRNSNTDGEIASEAASDYRPAINRIFHNASHPSRLILPIIER